MGTAALRKTFSWLLQKTKTEKLKERKTSFSSIVCKHRKRERERERDKWDWHIGHSLSPNRLNISCDKTIGSFKATFSLSLICHFVRTFFPQTANTQTRHCLGLFPKPDSGLNSRSDTKQCLGNISFKNIIKIFLAGFWCVLMSVC